MLFSIPPKYAVSQVVGFIKGKSAWMAMMRTICNPPLSSNFFRFCSGSGIWILIFLCFFMVVVQARAAAVNELDSALWRAVVAKDIKAVDAALGAGAYVDTPYHGRLGKADDALAPDARGGTKTSTLFEAAANGNKVMFNELLQRGASLQQRYDSNLILYDRTVRSSLLRPAVWGGNIDIVEVLLDAGLSWPKEQDEATDLLIVAVDGTGKGMFNGPDMFSYLRRHQIGGQTLSPELQAELLDFAFVQASDAMLEHLVAQVASWGETLLIKALRAQRSHLVLQLLESGRVELTAGVLEQALGKRVSMPPDLALGLLERGYRTLVAPYLADSISWAIERGQRENFMALANVVYDGPPPADVAGRWLASAVESGHSELAAELLSLPGIELNLNAQPVLALALLRGEDSLVSALLARGARADLVDRYFKMYRNAYGYAYSTLYWLCRKKQPAEWVGPLVANGARLDVRDHAGYMVVHCAAATGQLELLQALIDAGAEIDAVVESRSWRSGVRRDVGKTALMLAIDRGHNDVVSWLLKRGVGRLTALGTAIAAGNVEAIGILLDHGIDPSMEHFAAGMLEPASALALAVKAEQIAALDFLLKKGVRPAESGAFICLILEPGPWAIATRELRHGTRAGFCR